MRDLKTILEGIRNAVASADKWGSAVSSMVPSPTGARAALAGSLDKFFDKGDAHLGVLGTAESYMGQNNQAWNLGGLGIDKGGSYTSPGKTGKPAQPVVIQKTPPNVTLTLDGQMLGRWIVDEIGEMYKFDTNTPAANGAGIYGP
jgi:hypothetical protein